MAKNINVSASEDFTSGAKNTEQHADIISKNSTKEDITLNSNKSVKNNSNDKVNLF